MFTSTSEKLFLTLGVSMCTFSLPFPSDTAKKMNGINKEILGAIVTVVVAVGTKIVEEVSKNEEKKEEKKNA